MVLLQSGVPRSGNYWLYTMLQAAAQRAGIPQTSFVRSQPIYQEATQWHYFADQAAIDYIEIEPHGYFFRKGHYRQRIDDLAAYVQQCSHVWTHSHWSQRMVATLQQFDRVVYIIRDPRDIAISTSRFVFSPLMMQNHPQRERNPESFLRHRLYEIMLSWTNHVGMHLTHADALHIHIVFYERLLFDFEREFGNLLAYLGYQLNDANIAAIKQDVAFATMHKKNPDHVQKGTAGQWEHQLSQRQQRQILRIAAPLLTLLNYPLATAASATHLPTLPTSPIDTSRVHAALQQSRGTTFDKIRYGSAYALSKRPFAEKLQRGTAFLLRKGRWHE